MMPHDSELRLANSTHNGIDVASLRAPIHAIVCLRWQLTHGQRVNYQVVLDPKKITSSREFIRLGDVRGDEITGWQRCADVLVQEVLGEFEDNEPIPYIEAQAYPVDPRSPERIETDRLIAETG